ncbi:glycoside hydrolase family 75 protein [Aliiglaciecola sp. LCG003]|uniref:glycoside hydrolase family 75 protein n=1 Tax=Aliiglaciecola sp. LCG003 TaxID=3053655 RepID=UPI00257433DB|nr:glycoside hydrolase family 75 protein [Aliiglaciecola sp. LCG003]WJG10862.1 glycoside hydrolase family 75 protein [Aliiglaciecola sp. LCG003]
MKPLLLSVLLFTPMINALAEEKCEFQHWQEYKSSTLYRDQTNTAIAFTSNIIHLDADGAPNAYHPDDIGLPCGGSGPFKGLDCPANAGYPKSTWWPDVLVKSPTDPTEAYTQKEGQFAGFMVSKTALINANIRDVSDPNRYVDATTIPYLVYPGKFYKLKGSGKMGDLGVAYNLANGQSSAFVVGDVGPSKAELGEMSIRLAETLGGTSPNPRTGQGAPTGIILYVIFPFSSARYPWPLTIEQINLQANSMLDQIGGIDAVKGCR